MKKNVVFVFHVEIGGKIINCEAREEYDNILSVFEKTRK